MEHEAEEEQGKTLFPVRESVAYIVRDLELNKTLKERVNKAVVSCATARIRQAEDNLFSIPWIRLPVVRHSSNSDGSERRKTERTNKAKKNFSEETKETLL